MNIYEIIIRLLLAVVIGGSIGYERESNNRPAGFRTHIFNVTDLSMLNLMKLVYT